VDQHGLTRHEIEARLDERQRFGNRDLIAEAVGKMTSSGT
jgi:hypothetical protein